MNEPSSHDSHIDKSNHLDFDAAPGHNSSSEDDNNSDSGSDDGIISRSRSTTRTPRPTRSTTRKTNFLLPEIPPRHILTRSDAGFKTTGTTSPVSGSSRPISRNHSQDSLYNNIYSGSYVSRPSVSRGISQDRIHNESSNKNLDPNRYSGFSSYSRNSSMDFSGLISRSPSPNRVYKKGTGAVSLRSLSKMRLNQIFPKFNEDLDSYGLEELREGFFDAIFTPHSNMRYDKRPTLAEERDSILQKTKQSVIEKATSFIQIKVANILVLLHDIMITKNGIALTKSFLAYFISFIICVIPASMRFLGPNCYLAPFSVLLHHSGRTSGSQLEITIESIVGISFGLGWGSLALYIGSLSGLSKNGYIGIHAASILLGMIISSWFRASFVRLYHLLLSFSLALVFVETLNSGAVVSWRVTWNFGMPYLFGILICLIVNLAVFPDFYNQSIYENLQGTIEDCKLSLIDCLDGTEGDKELINDRIQARLNNRSIEMTEFFRSLCNEITISTFKASDIKLMRNYFQVAISRIRAIPVPTVMFKPLRRENQNHENITINLENPDDSKSNSAPFIFLPENTTVSPPHTSPIEIVKKFFEPPTREVIFAMIQLLDSSNDFITYSYKGEQTKEGDNNHHVINHESVHLLLNNGQNKLIKASDELTASYKTFLGSEENMESLLHTQEVIDMFLFIHYIKQTAKSFINLSRELVRVSQSKRKWKINLPYYPFMRALRRTTRQIIHDRGGEITSHYFQTKREVDEAFVRAYNLNTSKHAPSGTNVNIFGADNGLENGDTKHKGDIEFHVNSAIDHMDFSEKVYQTDTFRYKTWKILHRLQGYESRFSMKASIIVFLLCLPSWVNNNDETKIHWYNKYDAWWSVIFALILLHPRVTGDFYDLVIRATWCIVGILWGAFAFAAGNGSPYVMCVFCAIFMIPTLYRYSISPYPRSGLIGCVSFTSVSLGLYVDARYSGSTGVIQGTWTRGIALLVGLFFTFLVNWIFWPFVARHQVRKAMSNILSNISQCYQIVTDRYLYHDNDDDPTELALELSEIREARMRQSFHAFKNLLEGTRHEPSLRGNFDPTPYEKMIELCEEVFQKIVVARISSTYFKVYEHDKNENTTRTLMSLRRDSVASVLLIFYILSNGFKSKHKIPRYLPSAAASRNHLYNQIMELELEDLHADNQSSLSLASFPDDDSVNEASQAELLNQQGSLKDLKAKDSPLSVKGKGINWHEVHIAAFSKAFTDMIEDLEQIISCSKSILGEEQY